MVDSIFIDGCRVGSGLNMFVSSSSSGISATVSGSDVIASIAHLLLILQSGIGIDKVIGNNIMYQYSKDEGILDIYGVKLKSFDYSIDFLSGMRSQSVLHSFTYANVFEDSNILFLIKPFIANLKGHDVILKNLLLKYDINLFSMCIDPTAVSLVSKIYPTIRRPLLDRLMLCSQFCLQKPFAIYNDGVNSFSITCGINGYSLFAAYCYEWIMYFYHIPNARYYQLGAIHDYFGNPFNMLPRFTGMTFYVCPSVLLCYYSLEYDMGISVKVDGLKTDLYSSIPLGDYGYTYMWLPSDDLWNTLCFRDGSRLRVVVDIFSFGGSTVGQGKYSNALRNVRNMSFTLNWNWCILFLSFSLQYSDNVSMPDHLFMVLDNITASAAVLKYSAIGKGMRYLDGFIPIIVQSFFRVRAFGINEVVVTLMPSYRLYAGLINEVIMHREMPLYRLGIMRSFKLRRFIIKIGCYTHSGLFNFGVSLKSL